MIDRRRVKRWCVFVPHRDFAKQRALLDLPPQFRACVPLEKTGAPLPLEALREKAAALRSGSERADGHIVLGGVDFGRNGALANYAFVEEPAGGGRTLITWKMGRKVWLAKYKNGGKSLKNQHKAGKS